ncbi:JDVT-CTERM system glutamic-type intramembrane protease [Oxalobacteraceae bacterium R-40]|uniref:JDVT-CTERM system glutamic-type intramembrane protease n=1 Tax=Keguizhuia sedimenti TaxID=3064264 RepID=A0ABU1BJK1_9BURK|nr:JDVT-CTERM system glutamic-type intramembrane protease [Oxalobacteraceae bacterium R-40]
MHSILTESFGLQFRPSFLRDGQFYLAIAIAPLPLIALSYLAPGWNTGMHAGTATIFSLVIWQPLVEELLFRGFIQGRFEQWRRAREKFLFFSLANYCTTLLFVAAHLFNQSAWWAAAVAVPSLLFGYFRDRHENIYPSIVLHASYNACYLAFGTLQKNAMPIGG